MATPVDSKVQESYQQVQNGDAVTPTSSPVKPKGDDTPSPAKRLAQRIKEKSGKMKATPKSKKHSNEFAGRIDKMKGVMPGRLETIFEKTYGPASNPSVHRNLMEMMLTGDPDMMRPFRSVRKQLGVKRRAIMMPVDFDHVQSPDLTKRGVRGGHIHGPHVTFVNAQSAQGGVLDTWVHHLGADDQRAIFPPRISDDVKLAQFIASADTKTVATRTLDAATHTERFFYFNDKENIACEAVVKEAHSPTYYPIFIYEIYDSAKKGSYQIAISPNFSMAPSKVITFATKVLYQRADAGIKYVIENADGTHDLIIDISMAFKFWGVAHPWHGSSQVRSLYFRFHESDLAFVPGLSGMISNCK